MKTITIGLIIFYGCILYPPESKAGIAGIITYLKGECNEPDENGIKLCSSRETGKIYYVNDAGEVFETYPNLKKD